jgi:hypothetical protein
MRKLKRAHPDDVAGVLDRLTESERKDLVALMEGRGKESPSRAPQPEPIVLAGLSNALAARIFPPQQADDLAPRMTPQAQKALRELAEAFARTATGAPVDAPIAIRPARRQLFAALLDHSYERPKERAL